MLNYTVTRMRFSPCLLMLCAFSLWVVWAGCGQIQGLNNELIKASKNGDAISVQHLLNRGADVNARDEWMNTALAWAVLGDHSSCAILLLEAGANANAVSFKGLSPLHLATINGNAKMVKFLLTKGADVNAKDNYQYTVLMNAINMGDIALVQILLESGADVHAKNDLGQLPLLIAKNNHEKEIIRMLKYFGATATDEIISGRIKKTDQGIILSVDNGDAYVLEGKDLSEMIGQSVTVTGTLTESESGKILTVSSVEPASEPRQIMNYSDGDKVDPMEE